MTLKEYSGEKSHSSTMRDKANDRIDRADFGSVLWPLIPIAGIVFYLAKLFLYVGLAFGRLSEKTYVMLGPFLYKIAGAPLKKVYSLACGTPYKPVASDYKDDGPYRSHPKEE